MITREEAQQLALEYISKHWNLQGAQPVILEEATIERDFGWVFFYDSSKHLATDAISDALAGNAPIIVNKHDGSLHATGTARPIEEYIQHYEKTGGPHI